MHPPHCQNGLAKVQSEMSPLVLTTNALLDLGPIGGAVSDQQGPGRHDIVNSLRCVLDLLRFPLVERPHNTRWCHRYYAGGLKQDNQGTREQDLQDSPNAHRRR